MACWNLDESGKCKNTGNICNSNEFECSIAKTERRITFAQSRNNTEVSIGTSSIIILGILLMVGGYILQGAIILLGIAVLALGIALKVKTRKANIFFIIGGIGIALVGLWSLPNHESRDLPMILSFIVTGFIISIFGIIYRVIKLKKDRND